MKVLVTGGAGFIGGAVVRRLMRDGASVVNVDKLTYAATPEALAEFDADPRYAFVQADIGDAAAMGAAFNRHRPEAVIHLAAESHVDRSIDAPETFIQTNVLGTYTILQAALSYHEHQPASERAQFRFLHVSTDEVFGALAPNASPFTETTPYAPRSPYAASKAASDHLVKAWGETYGLPVVLTNCTNNYGPWQFPEKLIPLMIAKALDGQSLPVYGAGDQVRDWLHVDDHAAALCHILEHGRTGETYAIGARAERRNIDVVRAICGLLDRRRPGPVPYADRITYVADRPGHDRRYAIDPSKLERQLDWRPEWGFEAGLAATVDWYLAHETWWRAIVAHSATGNRQGMYQRRAAE